MDKNEQKRDQYIEHILQNIPHQPGVYKMKGKDGEILYIGKAKDLKNRVSSYFQKSDDKPVRILKMIEQIYDIEYIVVGSELEALLLETNLIKEFRPKYNVLMKDDKNYVYVKITVDEPYPRIFLVRKVNKDKARYFGPKTAAHKVIKTLKILKRIFPFRHCHLSIDYVMPAEIGHKVKVTKANIKYPCLDYHIKRCIGPCIGKVSPEEYRKIIDQVIRFLEGKHDEISEKLKTEMMEAAQQKKFEKAANIRDKLKMIEEITESQRVSDPHQKDLDIIHYVEAEEKVYFNLFQLRQGKLIGQENFILESKGEQQSENKDALMAFLEQYYEKATDLPVEVLIPHEIDDMDLVESWLSEMKGQKVHLIVPERGKKNHLLELSLQNARSFMNQSQVKWQGEEKNVRTQALERLRQLLNLPKLPNRLECFDISHFSGRETVSSMVVFENGFPKKSDYRHFKLHQEISGAPNDFASMEETLLRRLKYLKPLLEKTSLQFSKIKKSDLETRLSELQIDQISAGTFLFDIKKDKERIGSFFLLQNNKKVFLRKILVMKDVDWRQLFKKIAEKMKVKRLYIVSDPENVAKFEENGCQIVHKSPDEYKKQSEDEVLLVFDRLKYKDDESFKKMPDLLIIDGGKGQLSSAQKALKLYHLEIPMVSLAKREEEIFLPQNPEPIVLAKDDPLLHMIQHIRDEAHRFAVTYHQNLRLKATTHSILDTITGIGPEYRKKLLQTFGSLEKIKTASLDEISAVVGLKNAQKIKEKLL